MNRVWGVMIQSEHCSLYCCNSISTVLRSDGVVWRGRPGFWCPCDHLRRLVICWVMTWLISHMTELEKHQACSSIGIFSRHFGRRALIRNGGLRGHTESGEVSKRRWRKGRVYRVQDGIRWSCATGRSTGAGATESRARRLHRGRRPW